ncbi:hypothetical protein [Brevibacterium moorei]|uniref:hypothetical protein n=1 Tax=Brevibacterium moorei TaxID=2968457 RepID=UPI00211C3579|nr:hypothetical protein [Brevibacterium sp. 68QC2CO]MCQ9385138.1 hypothetical protein [Brevibacterium sp. 68QC2CO]
MMLSTTIKYLQDLYEKHGDLRVYIRDEDDGRHYDTELDDCGFHIDVSGRYTDGMLWLKGETSLCDKAVVDRYDGIRERVEDAITDAAAYMDLDADRMASMADYGDYDEADLRNAQVCYDASVTSFNSLADEIGGIAHVEAPVLVEKED